MKPAEGSTVIGKSVQLKGEITGTEELYVDGKIDGIIRLNGSRLVVGPNADLNTEVHVQDLVVLGKLNGPVQATGRVEIRQSGQLTGDITAARFSVEESAWVRGRVTLTGQDGRS